MHHLRSVLCAALLSLASGCMPQHAQDVSDVARDLNVAARFGRMDVATESTTDEMREAFVQHRARWGHDLRVVDTELTALNMKGKDEAEVFVDVSWMRIEEGLLRGTRVKQMWRNPGGGWKLAEETRESGDVGLFGERVVVLKPEPTPDAHFPTKVIRAQNER
jgi:hypothetical protein